LPAAARGLNLLLTEPGPVTDPASAIRLDHLVIRSGDPERTLALFSGRLGLELRLDRSNPAWGTQLLFFRCGNLVLQVSHDLAGGITDAPDRV
jgi:catechol 2,3-dioxygenase-like lactoylglutathione lyase family enzyme